jgi:hypothetical protein
VVGAAGHSTGSTSPTGLPGSSPGIDDVLTAREIEVLELGVAGLTNMEIADESGIASNSVKQHVNHVYETFGRSIPEAEPGAGPTRSARSPTRIGLKEVR